MTDNRHVSSNSNYPEVNYSPGNKWIQSLTKARLSNFTGGHFSDVNLSKVLYTARIDDAKYVKLQVWDAPGRTKPSFQEAMKQTFKSAKKGDSFGPSWVCALAIAGVEFDPGCEAMIFTTDGTPLQGITGGFGGDRRVEFIIPSLARNNGTYDFVIESSCNGMFGVPAGGDTINPPDMDRYFTLASADIVVPNQDAWHLMWDFNALKQIVEALSGNSILRNKALVAANTIMNVFDSGDISSIAKARKIADDVFGEGWAAKGSKVYEEGSNNETIYGIGHCHIDTAWLWPYSATQQKIARSWSTQIDLMDRYPEHRFACSSAQQYKWLEQLYPPLFQRIKTKIASGQFQPIGGQWLESDGNMPSGEAFARQFIFGQRYFKTRFGIICDTAWMPDSFGLNGALPQLMRLAGMRYFFTQKLSWNNINVFPHSTFNWVGIDGSPILCHMTPVETYTAQATVSEIQKGVTNNKNLESCSTALLVFGNGDGGGGPLAPMLENLRRVRAAANRNCEVPVVSMGKSVDDFFRNVEKTTDYGKTLPNWHGELYLEFHRGTYTSHGSIKKGNRTSEILLRDIEHVATLASLYKSSSYTYPQEQINDLWENILLNQFHDVLPGSAIGMVYEDAEKIYARVAKVGKALLEAALAALIPKSTAVTSASALQFHTRGRLIAYNTTPFSRLDVVRVPLDGIGGAHLRTEAVQIARDGRTGLVLVDGTAGAGLVQARGLFADVQPASARSESDNQFVLQNSNVQLTISNGRITSLYDRKLKRELIRQDSTGGLIIYDDRPNYWDAWDVEIHHLETPHQLAFTKVAVTETGPVHAALFAEVTYGKSTIKTMISLDAIAATINSDSRSCIRFDAEVDWHERHKFLKFEIPLDLHSNNATYETPFGYVQRPTHKNTTWDIAKFEVCGHKYADLSEYGYGVAILSSSKYGFACRGNILCISLLRAATAPDADQDQGHHEFAWAVLPHVGDFLQSDVVAAGYLYNSPLHLRYLSNESPYSGGQLPKAPFTISGASNVILETIKRGDDEVFGCSSESAGNTTRIVILRLYEALGGHATAQLKIAEQLNVKRVALTNLLEEEMEELSITKIDGGSSVSLAFRTFQVLTVKLELGTLSVAPAHVHGESSSGEWTFVA